LAEKKTGARAILVVSGPNGSGKTTVSTMLGEAFARVSLLYIDASVDCTLSHLLTPDKTPGSVAQLFSHNREMLAQSDETSPAPPDENAKKADSSPPSTMLRQGREENSPSGTSVNNSPEASDLQTKALISGGREAIDWTFSELTVPVGDDSDLLMIGDLTTALDLRDKEKLAYGLKRLMDSYETIIIDGEHPLIMPLLPREVIHLINVVTPAHFEEWQTPLLQEQSTPVVILNEYGEEKLPVALEEALQQQHLRLLAKIPKYANDAERGQKMSQQLESAFLRLNIPMFPV